MDSATLRVLDANLNRAREALRVLEEHARLVLGDEAMTARIKSLRHVCRETAEAFGTDALLAARDIQHDVGTRVSTDLERSRSSTSQVAAAAAKRAAESLRSIEEYGKIINAQAAARVEQTRYELYAIEQDIHIGGPRRKRLRSARLHVLVTEALCGGPWLTVCEQALAGGADVLQLREKSVSDRELLDRAKQLRDLTRQHDALLFVNDRPDIARLADADGVHVGQHDLSVAEARQIAGPNVLVGTSTHSLEEANAAIHHQPDYIAVGTVFASPTKPDVPVQGPALLAEVARLTDIPLVAIGGITMGNISKLSPHTLLQIAVCRSVIGSHDPAAAARDLKQRLPSFGYTLNP
ncbi:MAG: thiamine phosphate synthase [Phycisphaerae bacterium]|nr:thiamine phosphate synthase [Phycisphaerae bacterium]